jgi:hypothetical protein
MFGAYVRGAGTAAFSVLIAALLQPFLSFFLAFLPQESLLYRSLNAIGENSLLIMLLAVGAGVIAAAAVQSGGR